MFRRLLLKGLEIIFYSLVIFGTIKGALAVSVVSYDLILNSSINQAQVNIPLNITLAPNSSIYLNLIKSDPRLNYTYSSEIYYNESDHKTIWINISYQDIFDQNVSSLFNLTNSLNNNSYLYNITLHFLPDQSVEAIGENFINVLNGDYMINITTDLLPKTGELEYEIAGLYGSQLNISCTGSWLTCPSNQTFGQNNQTIFQVSYNIPIDAPLGERITSINLTTGNVSVKRNIIFNVKEPDLILKSYEFREECFIIQSDGSLAVTYECILEQEEYNIQRLSTYLDIIQKQRNYTCDPEIINHTEYLIVGNIEEDISNEIDRLRLDISTCVSDKENLRIEKKELEKEKNSWISSYNDVNRKLIQNETACLSTVFSTSVKLKRDAENIIEENKLELKKLKIRHYRILFGIIILILLVLGVFRYLKSSSKEGWGTW